MHRIRPYHFARPQRQGAQAFCDRVRSCGGAVCFDLEDSVHSPDPVECRALKAQRRREVLSLIGALGDDPELPPVFVRLNAPSTAAYDLDLAALRTLPRLPGLFLPKVESADDLAGLLRDVSEPPPAVIPVVESRRGFAALDEVFAFAHPSFTEVAFGHCDYNLDCGHFPFHHQDAAAYWTWIARLDEGARRVGKGVVNSPVLRLDDRALFRSVLARLADYPSVRGQITLSLGQTEQCASPSPDRAADRPGGPASPPSVQSVVRTFEQHQVVGGYFAIDSERTVISPQEYQAARRFLKP